MQTKVTMKYCQFLVNLKCTYPKRLHNEHNVQECLTTVLLAIQTQLEQLYAITWRTDEFSYSLILAHITEYCCMVLKLMNEFQIQHRLSTK